jgi:predicted alpha/beta superfamily hydrolase
MALLLPALVAGALLEASVQPKTLSGHVERLTAVWSPQLGNERDILVWLPPGYAASTQRYPVVYMQDGQNVFDEATSFAGREWRADETAARLASQGLPLVVVAIPNAGAERLSEYSPFVTVSPPSRGLGDRYVAFLADTLKPLVDGRYRTDPAPGRTAVVGSSMGGLVSLHAACTRPDVFGLAGVHSPSLWFADRAMLRALEDRPAASGLRMWIDIGTQEGHTPAAKKAAVQDARTVAALLERQGVAVRLLVARGGRHHEDAWAERLEDALRFLYQKNP